MLLAMVVQIIILNNYLNKNEIKKRGWNCVYAIWISGLTTLLLWNVFDVVTFRLETLVTLSLSTHWLNTLLTIFSSLLTFNVMQLYIRFVKAPFIERYQQTKIKQILVLIVLLVPVFLGSLLLFSSYWAANSFGNLEFGQIVYMLNEPMEGTDPQQIKSYLLGPLLKTVSMTSVIGSLFYLVDTYKFRFRKKGKQAKYFFLGLMSVAILLVSSGMSVNKIGYADIKAYYFEQTKIYEEYYVDSKEVTLTFPEKKRNLIYIFLESMETSYASQEVGGVKPANLIPNLTHLALEEGIHFSHTEQLGGMMYLTGTGNTVSGMVSQSSGVPLIASTDTLSTNDYGDKGKDFLPGAYSLGEVLEKEGYNQVLFIGSEAKFAGKDKYFEQHGSYEIRDYDWAKTQGLIPEDYHVWWGYEDRKLFEFAKESLLELASQEEPFNFTMLTTDTHFEDGYPTEETQDLFGDQYSNVIFDNDRQVMAFLDWIKEQEFYEDTTIVLAGDHLTMDMDFFDNDASDYPRSVYNVFLNTNQSGDYQKNRIFTALDMFPTTLAALDVKIEGEQLGLGVNLFSGEQTLAEKISHYVLLGEVKKKSTFYSKNLMQGTDDRLLYEVEEE